MHVERFELHRDPDELDTLPMTLPLDIDCIEGDAANSGESHDPGLHAELSDEPPMEHEVPLHNFKPTPLPYASMPFCGQVPDVAADLLNAECLPPPKRRKRGDPEDEEEDDADDRHDGDPGDDDNVDDGGENEKARGSEDPLPTRPTQKAKAKAKAIRHPKQKRSNVPHLLSRQKQSPKLGADLPGSPWMQSLSRERARHTTEPGLLLCKTAGMMKPRKMLDVRPTEKLIFFKKHA